MACVPSGVFSFESGTGSDDLDKDSPAISGGSLKRKTKTVVCYQKYEV